MPTTPIFPAVVQTPKIWNASIGNGDASAWKPLLSANAGAGASGSKIVGVSASGNDSSSRIIQLAKLRTTVVTISVASPGVVTLSAANGNNLAVGDQLFLTTTGTLPTGLSPNTTYWVISGGFSAGASFELSTSAGGAAINTSGSQSGTHTAWIVDILTAQTLAVTGGTDGATAAADLMSYSLLPGLPVDNDGTRYLLLESGDYLGVATTTTVTANKIINVSAIGGNF